MCSSSKPMEPPEYPSRPSRSWLSPPFLPRQPRVPRRPRPIPGRIPQRPRRAGRTLGRGGHRRLPRRHRPRPGLVPPVHGLHALPPTRAGGSCPRPCPAKKKKGSGSGGGGSGAPTIRRFLFLWTGLSLVFKVSLFSLSFAIVCECAPESWRWPWCVVKRLLRLGALRVGEGLSGLMLIGWRLVLKFRKNLPSKQSGLAELTVRMLHLFIYPLFWEIQNVCESNEIPLAAGPCCSGGFDA